MTIALKLCVLTSNPRKSFAINRGGIVNGLMAIGKELWFCGRERDFSIKKTNSGALAPLRTRAPLRHCVHVFRVHAKLFQLDELNTIAK
jgi:hypothetical protein